MTASTHIQIDPFAEILQGRPIYHAAPLHYLPSILAHSKLISAELGAAHGIHPRKSAHRRDKMLGVHRYVHFSFDLMTPLLADKLAKGMPHCVLEFDAADVYADNPHHAALLPCNTKAWRSRADASPIDNPQQMAHILDSRERFGRYPSLEFLVDGWLDLGSLRTVWTFSDGDFDLINRTTSIFDPAVSPKIQIRAASKYTSSRTSEMVEGYIARCIDSRLIQPLPDIPFD